MYGPTANFDWDVVPKWFLVKDVVEFLYISLTILTTFRGKLRFSMRARSLAWSMKPKALRMSMYVRCMSLLASLVSSRVAMIICICLEVLHWGLYPSWLECSIICCSP